MAACFCTGACLTGGGCKGGSININPNPNLNIDWNGPTTTSVPVEPPCGYCSTYHDGTCPRVKAIEYYETGIVRRVEFHPPESTDDRED